MSAADPGVPAGRAGSAAMGRSVRVDAALDEVLAAVKALPHEYAMALAVRAREVSTEIHPALKGVYAAIGRVAQSVIDDALEAERG